MHILTSLLLAYIFYPFYLWINSKIKNKSVSAFIISVLIIILITIPIAYVLYEVSKEANVGYIVLKQKISTGTLFDIKCDGGTICNTFKELLRKPEARFYMEDSLKKITTTIAESTFNFIFSLPMRLLEIFVTFFLTFFLFKDGALFLQKIENLVPLQKKIKDRIFKQLHEVTRAVIKGFFIVALIEGILGALTFWIFGVPSPLIWGIVIGLLALVPIIGAAIIYVPAALIYFFQGNIVATIGIIVGGLIISVVDTFLKPKMVGEKASIHPVLVFLGFIGGISLFGFVGIIIGPLILVLTTTFIRIYKEGK